MYRKYDFEVTDMAAFEKYAPNAVETKKTVIVSQISKLFDVGLRDQIPGIKFISGPHKRPEKEPAGEPEGSQEAA